MLRASCPRVWGILCNGFTQKDGYKYTSTSYHIQKEMPEENIKYWKPTRLMEGTVGDLKTWHQRGSGFVSMIRNPEKVKKNTSRIEHLKTKSSGWIWTPERMQKDRDTVEEMRVAKSCLSGCAEGRKPPGHPLSLQLVLLRAGFCPLPGCPLILCSFGTWISSLPFGFVSNLMRE